MNPEERLEFEALLSGFKDTVNKDIQLAIAKMQILIMSVLLSNIIFIGGPAIYVFFGTTNTAERALTQAASNHTRLNTHAQGINTLANRLSGIETYLASKNGYIPPKDPAVPTQ